MEELPLGLISRTGIGFLNAAIFSQLHDKHEFSDAWLDLTCKEQTRSRKSTWIERFMGTLTN